MASALKRVLVGKPIASSAESTQRLTKLLALAVFSSDAVSSSAYATEEILDVLVPEAGLARAIDTLIPISVAVVVLLALVVFNYHQTIRAYPGGGGSYIVSRENLGTNPSLDAAGDGFTTVVLPELAVDHAWQESLHNQSLLALASQLRGRDRTVVATYSYRVDA